MSLREEYLQMLAEKMDAEANGEFRRDAIDYSDPYVIAYADQLSAAANELDSLLAEPDGIEDVPAPKWARIKMLRTLVGWFLEQDYTCQHAPTPDRPEPVAAVPWMGNLVVCADCAATDYRFSHAPRVCDGCGDEAVGLLRLRTGAMVFSVPTCEVCAHVA